MLWCLILIGAYLTRMSGGKFKWFPGESMKNLHGSDFEDVRLPNALRDDVTEKSFAARPINNIRLPHGPNPQVKHIENFRFFENERFRRKYQENLHTMWVDNQDWRLDNTMFGIRNSFLRVHDPEDNYKKIEGFRSRRQGKTRDLTFEPESNKALVTCY